MGIALISLLTANFSAYFISKGTSEVAHTEEQILRTLQEVQKRLDKIEEHLKNK
jgi:voltage-gated potassium channel